ncbi:phosphoinositide 3-kinase adapter protein 1 isoform X2 [Brienomyrus brachyistius]|uniref:phosphoinositide 3-kinase adapter protein 1 isoform X2 n=1 Tax=Brienomyrus brachyistius TaxID=42636 RepID=UPI0020B3E723|nr:phosphoinositide 3-kinase adapter protein 1 isoform X2 [Brienomyrus brachyistius]
MMSESFISPTISTYSYQVLIVYTSEAEEWATYLQNVLSSSQKFSDESVLLYPVTADFSLEEDEFAIFNASRCIVLLLSMEFLDMQSNPGVLETYKKVFHPPSKMVLFFCGVSESELLNEHFGHWHTWRKLYPDDDPAIYISTVLESISDGDDDRTTNETETETAEYTTQMAEREEGEGEPSVSILECSRVVQLPQEDCVSKQEAQTPHGNDENVCLIVQPDRILCGTKVTIYILLKCKLDAHAETAVEFSCEERGATREAGTIENEYTVSVMSPEMPSGRVLLSLYSDDLIVCSKSLTYFTGMEEVNRYLESVTNPLEFFSQAFNITSNCRESLDKVLADLLKSRIPASGFEIFGINQLEEENMSAYQRDEELPTLLHFAAKYGLKNLMTLLLKCPGAMQAYSVGNKHGDYPNNIAEKNGFLDLRRFMDKYVENAGKDESHLKESITEEEPEDVYEAMSKTVEDSLTLNTECKEDIYESMLELDPDCIQDLYEDMEKAIRQSLNPEEAMLRSFFQAGTTSKAEKFLISVEETYEEETDEGNENIASEEEEEDPYNFCAADEIYDTLDELAADHISQIISRPPAPIPRPLTVVTAETEENKTYISRVFSEKPSIVHQDKRTDERPVRGLDRDRPQTTAYDPYAGMKTPGQRQLISLQERVKVGDISVEEAVQEFKEWQMNQEKRSQSLRFQQENLKRLRDSITRRQKEKVKMGKEMEITAPLQHSPWQDMAVKLECAVYEPCPRVNADPVHIGNWQKESTSCIARTGSKQLSTNNASSYTSRIENDYEDDTDSNSAPSLPPRNIDLPPLLPPRIPPRYPERFSEGMVSDRYTFCPTRPQKPPERSNSPPPIPRRTR